jgi:lactoylglutathione lyase
MTKKTRRIVGVVALVAMCAAPALMTSAAELPAGASVIRASFLAVSMRVTDLQKSVDFYTHGLGMIEAGRIESATATEVILNYEGRPGAPGISLFKDKTSEQPLQMGNAYSRLSINVPDLEGLSKRLAKAGYPLQGPINNVPQSSMRVAMARDPDGYLLEIVQWDGTLPKQH